MTPQSVAPGRLRLIRIVGLCLLAFLALLSYAISRPAVDSLFLEVHTHRQLPVVWLLAPILMVLCVAVYNRFVISTGLLRLYGAVALISGVALLILMTARQLEMPGVHYLLYSWKEIYVVVLVEIFYSYANALFPIRSARWIYGLFGLMAAGGSLTGSVAVGQLARHLGTAGSLWTVPPLLLIIGLLCVPFARAADTGIPKDQPPPPASIGQAVHILRRSSYLTQVLALIIIVQVVITLIDFEYSRIVELFYPITDKRTEFIGLVYGSIDVGSSVMNGLTGPILRLAGLPATLLFIPVLLWGGVFAFMLRPGLTAVSLVKVASKAFDYSLFRSAKEMLYIPLTYSEKTMGKSMIDMMSYRLAKGGASLLLLGLSALGVDQLITPMTLAMILVWLAVTVIIIRRFRGKVSREREMLSTAQ